MDQNTFFYLVNVRKYLRVDRETEKKRSCRYQTEMACR